MAVDFHKEAEGYLCCGGWGRLDDLEKVFVLEVEVLQDVVQPLVFLEGEPLAPRVHHSLVRGIVGPKAQLLIWRKRNRAK